MPIVKMANPSMVDGSVIFKPSWQPYPRDNGSTSSWSGGLQVKRFLAHATEHLLEVVISTHKAAMSRAYRLPELFRALCHGDGPWLRRAFEALIRYLGVNAKRAHPRRDVRTGRSRLGLKPIFELTDNTELTDTYKDRKAA